MPRSCTLPAFITSATNRVHHRHQAGAAGFLAGRRLSDLSLRRMLNGNYGWLNSGERHLVRALVNNGHAHLFRAWPKPGVRDDAKRRLLTAAAAQMGAVGTGGGVEDARLQVLQPPAAPKRPHNMEMHNDLRVDDYYW
jgi:hypothetical protein